MYNYIFWRDKTLYSPCPNLVAMDTHLSYLGDHHFYIERCIHKHMYIYLHYLNFLSLFFNKSFPSLIYTWPDVVSVYTFSMCCCYDYFGSGEC